MLQANAEYTMFSNSMLRDQTEGSSDAQVNDMQSPFKWLYGPENSKTTSTGGQRAPKTQIPSPKQDVLRLESLAMLDLSFL